MNNQEAKFILGAYRPDGRDASDVTFAEAVAQAERDPELRGWWERQRAWDAAMAAKLREVAPPPGLREAILAGGRASQPRRPWWSNPAWLAAAAAVVLVAALTVTLPRRSDAPGAAELATFALRDLEDAHAAHEGFPTALAGIQAQLANASLPLPAHLTLNLDDLRRRHCRTVHVRGREVLEVCFQRGGTWFHLYAARRRDFAPGAQPQGLFLSHGDYAATAWVDATHVYSLVTHAGADALRRVI